MPLGVMDVASIRQCHLPFSFAATFQHVPREIDHVFAAVRNNSRLVEFPLSNRVEQRTYYLRSAWI